MHAILAALAFAVIASGCSEGTDRLALQDVHGRVASDLRSQSLPVTSVACNPRNEPIQAGDSFACSYTTTGTCPESDSRATEVPFPCSSPPTRGTVDVEVFAYPNGDLQVQLVP